MVWTSIHQQLVVMGGDSSAAAALKHLPQFASWLRTSVASATDIETFVGFVNFVSSKFWEDSMRARWSCASPSRSGVYAQLDLSDMSVCAAWRSNTHMQQHLLVTHATQLSFDRHQDPVVQEQQITSFYDGKTMCLQLLCVAKVQTWMYFGAA